MPLEVFLFLLALWQFYANHRVLFSLIKGQSRQEYIQVAKQHIQDLTASLDKLLKDNDDQTFISLSLVASAFVIWSFSLLSITYYFVSYVTISVPVYQTISLVLLFVDIADWVVKTKFIINIYNCKAVYIYGVKDYFLELANITHVIITLILLFAGSY